ncbi:MAG: xanthine dehydrogenase [Spirochaetaceae bacterium]|nr:MAG: xanthine dehydrogenase [Spirochaetaceae bacterium]
MSGTLVFTLNGTKVEADRLPRRTLLDWLRDERGLIGTKNGCGVGQCGACSVLVDGTVQRACVVKLDSLNGSTIETIESLVNGGALDPVQQAFVAEGAVQCGFCTPGMVMAAKALLQANPRPSESQIRAALQPNLCRCTGYASIVRAVQRAAGLPTLDADGTPREATAPDEAVLTGTGTVPGAVPAARPADRPVIGSSPVRKDAIAKVKGERIFADDYSDPEQLYGVLAFSEEHHARIVALDCRAARRAAGVVRVFTAADIPGRNAFGLQLQHQPVFADTLVRYRGEPLALVVAETRQAARKAARLIKATYEPLAVLHNPDEALAEGAAQLHDGGNVAETVRFSRGDVERAFAEADLVVEGEYTTPAVEHAYLEPESCLALPGRSPGITVYTANQGSGAFQEMIARTLAIDTSEVRVVYTPAGGGFGGKEEPTVQIQAALAALLLQRPVKVTLDRAESLRISTKRHAARIRMRHAVRNDGTLLGIESYTVCDAGAYLSLTRPVVFRTVVMAGGPYEIPNARLESHGVYTNTNPSGAFRGFGSTQICFASELQMDKIAGRLGVDPVELRRRNALAPGKMTVMGHRLSSGVGYLGTVDGVAAALSQARAAITAAPGKRLGIGFASAYKNVGIGKGMPDEASAAVELGPAGRFTVYVGATDIGQGSDTIMAQIAADTLGVPYETVSVVSSDTACCPDAGMTTASRQTYISGNAVAAAARTLKSRLDRQGGTPAEIYAAADDTTWLRVEERYRPPATAKLPEVYEDASITGPDGLPVHFTYCYTSMAAIIEIAPDGSGLKVLKLITAQDVGRALHPQNVYGQVEGAAVMGFGYSVSERFECGRNGKPTLSLDALGLPRCADSPALQSLIVEEPEADGPFGAKGLGEIPLNPAAPAIAAAIHNAIGRYIDHLPLTAALPR